MYKVTTLISLKKFLSKLFSTVLCVLLCTFAAYSNHHTNKTYTHNQLGNFASNYYNFEDTIKAPKTADDSIKIPKKSGMAFDYPVFYDAEDSLLFDFIKQKAYLYGKAVVIYEAINLTSEFIEMDFEKNEVFAFGFRDSLGEHIGKPMFKEGEETFYADSIRYNFKTKKGIIKEVTSEFEGSFLHGSKTKMHPNRHVHLIDGKFTTCDHEHPHYYFRISKGVVIPNDKIVCGPAYLVIEDIPTPLGIPFGFFPNSSGGSSGVIIPEFGEEQNRGFFLRNGGYYWAINDFVDLTVLGDIYSKGSWGLGMMSNYKVRYKYSGRLDFKYNKNVTGYRDINYNKADMYAFRWKFNQDPKARPNSTFAADVNISSSKFDQYNSYSANNVLSTNKQSSISYSKTFPNSPFSLTAALRQNQNNSTQAISLTLPDVSFNMSRIYPLKRKAVAGKSRFYEKIGVSYTMNMTNRINTSDSAFFDLNFDSFTNGISHRIPVNTSFKFLKYTTINPSFNYNERWYFKAMQKQWIQNPENPALGELTSQYNALFSRVWDYNLAANWSTQIYGTFNFKKGNLKALRHVITPSINFSYLPDFGTEKYNYYDDYNRIMYNSNTGQYDTVSQFYSRFEGLPYGVPTRGGAGSVNFNIGNNLEMKLRNKGDTVTPDRKVKLLESFNVSSNYNIKADSLNWAPISVNGRTRIKFLDLNFSSTLDPYAIERDPYDTTRGVRVNKLAFDVNDQYVRLTRANVSAGFSLNSSKTNNKHTEKQEMFETLYGYPENYVDFDIPWNVRVNYSLTYDKPYYDSRISQTINFSGDFNLTKKWKINFSSGYDIKLKKSTYTTIDIYRDLHCWEASLHMVPFGSYKSYMFQINVKASMLQDLKLAKRRNWQDNF